MNTNFKKIETDWLSIWIGGLIILSIIAIIVSQVEINTNNKVAFYKTIQNATEQGYLNCLNDLKLSMDNSIETCKPLVYKYVYPVNNLTYQINFHSANCLNVTK